LRDIFEKVCDGWLLGLDDFHFNWAIVCLKVCQCVRELWGGGVLDIKIIQKVLIETMYLCWGFFAYGKGRVDIVKLVFKLSIRCC